MKKSVLLIALLAACGSKKTSEQKTASDKPLVQDKDIPDGLDLRLSNGKAGPPTFDRSKLAPAKKLGDADVQTILARAEALAEEPGDKQDFALRPASTPPPRTGTTKTTCRGNRSSKRRITTGSVSRRALASSASIPTTARSTKPC